MRASPTWLVTGAAGQLGRELVRVLGVREPVGTVTGLGRADLDVTDRVAVHGAVAGLGPDVVVNCAAWTDVDGCELDPERAHRVNADAVGFLREACERAGAHLVHVSTDYVFSGEASEPYPEGHPTGPVNAYGVSKLAGEVAAGLEATVVRTAWLQSVDGANVFRSVLSQLAEPEEVFFVDDQHGSPTFVADLAPVILRLGVERAAGVVHATNAGTTSWYGFACEVARASGHDPERVHPICEDDLDASRSARRPAYSALDNAVLRDLGYEPMRHHRDAIADAVAGLRGEGA
jgi:dTDP-4-dehydrorhamnose reductase